MPRYYICDIVGLIFPIFYWCLVLNSVWCKSQFIICRKASLCHIGKKYARISLKNLKDKPNLRRRVNVELVIMMRCYFMRVYVKLLYFTVEDGKNRPLQ